MYYSENSAGIEIHTVCPINEYLCVMSQVVVHLMESVYKECQHLIFVEDLIVNSMIAEVDFND